MFSIDPVDRFSERYNLKKEEVERYIAEGRWEELRQSHTDKALETLGKAQKAILEDLLDDAVKLLQVEALKFRSDVNFQLEHIRKYKHPYKVDDQTQEVLMDMNGRPIPIFSPKFPEKSVVFAQGVETRLRELNAELKKLAKAKDIIEAEKAPSKIQIEGLFDIPDDGK